MWEAFEESTIDFFVLFRFGFLSLILNTSVLPSTALGTKEVQAMLDSVYHFGADSSVSVFHPWDTEAGGHKLRPSLLLHTFHVNRRFGLISLCKRYNQSYDRILWKWKFKKDVARNSTILKMVIVIFLVCFLWISFYYAFFFYLYKIVIIVQATFCTLHLSFVTIHWLTGCYGTRFYKAKAKDSPWELWSQGMPEGILSSSETESNVWCILSFCAANAFLVLSKYFPVID